MTVDVYANDIEINARILPGKVISNRVSDKESNKIKFDNAESYMHEISLQTSHISFKIKLKK